MPDSLLPRSSNSGPKYAAILVLLLAGGLGLWFWMSSSSSRTTETPVEPGSTVAAQTRGQFAAELEIPEGIDGAAEEAKSKRRRPVVACNGSLEASAIQSVINGLPRQQVRACYERGLKQNNELQGTVSLLLTIGRGGNVTHVTTRGTLNDGVVLRCMRTVARKWSFPQPEGGCVQTSVPFSLTPKR